MKKYLSLACLFGIAFSFMSCGHKSVAFNDNFVTEAAVYSDMSDVVGTTKKMARSSNGVVEEASINTSLSAIERKLIRNGSIRIEVSTLSDIDKKIEAFAKSFGGYVSYSNWNETNAFATIRIPAVKFDDAMNSASDFGKVKSHDVNANDVTDQFYDLQSRIETKKILRDKLQGYLKQAVNIKDMLEIERQLNDVMTELDSIEGRMKRLTDQIELSTINLEFNLPSGITETGFRWPDFGTDGRDFLVNVVSFISGFFWAICYIIVYGVPVVALLLLLFWLLFGKVGILRKLFNRLKK